LTGSPGDDHIASRGLGPQRPVHLPHLDLSPASFNIRITPDVPDMNAATGGPGFRAGPKVPQGDASTGGFHSDWAADVCRVDITTGGGQPCLALEGAFHANVATLRLNVQIEASRKFDVEFRSRGVVAMPRTGQFPAHINPAALYRAGAEAVSIENAARLFLASGVNAQNHATLELIAGPGGDFHGAHVRAQN
jgi:hypothetical protein